MDSSCGIVGPQPDKPTKPVAPVAGNRPKCPHCRAPLNCSNCGKAVPRPFASRDTSHGHKNQRKLEYFLNTKTPYEATREPKAKHKRASGAGMRPDFKIRHKDSLPGADFIYVERQEQNTRGTGNGKIADKINKAVLGCQDFQCKRYYIVLAGSRADLLQRVADDSFERGLAYRHERLIICHEDEFKKLAEAGKL